jgi:cysteine synthase A
MNEPPRFDPPGRGRIYDSVIETMGNTPLVRIPRVRAAEGLDADILLKLEFFNPLASVKDRIGVSMVLGLERDGKIGPGSTLVEATSGNTGIGLAFAAAARGYRCIVVMSEAASIERRKMMAFLGAELHLTPREGGIQAALDRADELVREIPGAVLTRQFQNDDNPDIHRRTTAEEIWRDTGGLVDVVVSGIGTSGTFTGIGQTLKPRRPTLRMVAVEPELSPVLSGGVHAPHMIQGIGAGIVPDLLDRSLIDEIMLVSNEAAIAASRMLARLEGITAGISSGAALDAAIRLARRPEMAGKMIVAIIPSFAERYLSTPLFEGIG